MIALEPRFPGEMVAEIDGLHAVSKYRKKVLGATSYPRLREDGTCPCKDINNTNFGVQYNSDTGPRFLTFE